DAGPRAPAPRSPLLRERGQDRAEPGRGADASRARERGRPRHRPRRVRGRGRIGGRRRHHPGGARRSPRGDAASPLARGRGDCRHDERQVSTPLGDDLEPGGIDMAPGFVAWTGVAWPAGAAPAAITHARPRPGAQIVVLGASGYTGHELTRLIRAHPRLDLTLVGARDAETAAGRLTGLDPHEAASLAAADAPEIV